MADSRIDAIMEDLGEFGGFGCHACDDCKIYSVKDCPKIEAARVASDLLQDKEESLCYVRKKWQAAEMKICSMCGYFLHRETDVRKGNVVFADSGNGKMISGTMTCGELNGWPCCGKFTPWIPVENRLPDKEWMEFGEASGRMLEVIVMIRGAQYPTVLCYDGHDGFFNDGFDEEKIYYDVTHWMPMPEGPEEVLE